MDGKLNGGYFVFNPGTPLEERIKNTLTADGAEMILQAAFQADDNFAAALYMGLSNASYTYESASVASIAAEEPSGNGYARAALTRNATDWTVSLINGIMRVQSKLCTFTASGNWSKNWSRAFIIDQTATKVIAASGAAPSERVVLTGQGPTVQYEFWLPG